MCRLCCTGAYRLSVPGRMLALGTYIDYLMRDFPAGTCATLLKSPALTRVRHYHSALNRRSRWIQCFERGNQGLVNPLTRFVRLKARLVIVLMAAWMVEPVAVQQ
jgi:hypothetical protein